MSATIDSPHNSTWTHRSCIVLFSLSRYLKLRNREVNLFVFSPKTTDPRVPDHVHWRDPGVLCERGQEEGGLRIKEASHNFTWRELVAKAALPSPTTLLDFERKKRNYKQHTDVPLTIVEHARGHSTTATPEPIMEVGYSVTIVAAWLR